MLKTLAVLTATLAMTGAAMAQPQGGPPPGGGNPAFAAVRAACKADGDKLCPGLQGPERGQCMRQNSDKLSQECKDALAKLGPPPSSAPAGK
jgi:hypothetical protein